MCVVHRAYKTSQRTDTLLNERESLDRSHTMTNDILECVPTHPTPPHPTPPHPTPPHPPPPHTQTHHRDRNHPLAFLKFLAPD